MSKITATKLTRKFTKQPVKSRIILKCLGCEQPMLVSVEQVCNTHRKCRKEFREEIRKIMKMRQVNTNK